MRRTRVMTLVLLALASSVASAQSSELRTGAEALVGWKTDAPGVRRHIKPEDLPAPPGAVGDPEASKGSPVKIVAPSRGALPKVPDGFVVEVFASGFKQPRTIRVAPSGEIFLSESGTGRVLMFGADARSGSAKPQVFAENLDRPYGIAFYPPNDPQYIYVAAANQVTRHPYRSRDDAAKQSGTGEVILGNIPTKRHWTRDLAFSRDGKRLFVSIGSASNLGANGMPQMTSEKIQQHEKTHGRGAAWGEEENRGVVRVLDPDGKNVRNFATGLRNCSGLAFQPRTDSLWCVVNERDHLGPNLVPDFVTHIQDRGFYGWPWYYIGNNEDPARKGQRPDLRGQVRTPEVLLQAHSSALAIAFYDHDAFPAEYRGDAFVTLHGSHTRPDRTGYKVVRVRMKGGTPTGEYEDFMTGFLIDNDTAWGRPAGIAVTKDGALLVTDDANGFIYRVARK